MTFKQQFILFCINLYNALHELWSIYSVRLIKIWNIAAVLLQQTNTTYYFKGANEYPLPPYLFNRKLPLLGLNKCVIKENFCEWNTTVYNESKPKKHFECLAGTLHIDRIEYEIPSNLLCIKSSSRIVPTYEQWIQVLYGEMNISTTELPAKIVLIDDMGDSKEIRIGLEFNEMMKYLT
jgi:hypothetical protein